MFNVHKQFIRKWLLVIVCDARDKFDENFSFHFFLGLVDKVSRIESKRKKKFFAEKWSVNLWHFSIQSTKLKLKSSEKFYEL